MPVSAGQELPLWEPRGALQPLAAPGACTKTASNGGNLKKTMHFVPLIPKPGFQMRVQGAEACSSC